MEAWESKLPLPIPFSCFYVSQDDMSLHSALPASVLPCLFGRKPVMPTPKQTLDWPHHPQRLSSTCLKHLIPLPDAVPSQQGSLLPLLFLKCPLSPCRVARMNLWEGQLHCAALPRLLSTHLGSAAPAPVALPLAPCFPIPCTPAALASLRFL